MKLSECRIGTLVTHTTIDDPTLKPVGYVSGLVMNALGEVIPEVTWAGIDHNRIADHVHVSYRRRYAGKTMAIHHDLLSQLTD
jgi:hypothetical protein